MSFIRRAVSVMLSLAILSLPVVVFAERQNIYDWWQLRNYYPPTTVSQLATNTTMDNYSRKLFYVNHPQLDSLSSFHQDCSDSERTIVLGCFREGKGIFLYNVQDPRLSGVLEVTAAHETLHAAYARLSTKERQHVDDMTQQVFNNLNDDRIKSTVAQYRAQDPSVVPNELHSILGTEVRNLPPQLEQYYKRYFNNREAIVGYSEKYEAEFTSRSAKIADYDKQLNSLKNNIVASEQSLDSQLNDLQASRKQLEALLASGQRDAYNQQVPVFNAKVAEYNKQVRVVQSQISQYNELVAQRNELAKEVQDLVGAIDTRGTPQTISGQ